MRPFLFWPSRSLTAIEGMPRTSGRALQQHHVLAMVAIVLVGITALAALAIVFITRKRKTPYSRGSLTILLGATIASSVALG
jgi:LPXTG-motif cell wall-anchored protein